MSDTPMSLAERVEKADGPDRELDAAIAAAVGAEHGEKSGWCNNHNGDYYVIDECAARYTGSVDAALSLAQPLMSFRLGWHEPNGRPWHGALTIKKEPYEAKPGTGATPALAICAAALRAIAQADRNAKRQDPEEGLGPKDESPVGNADAPLPSGSTTPAGAVG